jgi:hypothetical protein
MPSLGRPVHKVNRPTNGQLAAGVILAAGIAVGLVFGCFWSMRGKAKSDTGYTQGAEDESFFDDGL